MGSLLIGAVIVYLLWKNGTLNSLASAGSATGAASPSVGGGCQGCSQAAISGTPLAVQPLLSIPQSLPPLPNAPTPVLATGPQGSIPINAAIQLAVATQPPRVVPGVPAKHMSILE